MVKAAEDGATEPAEKVICALTRTTITGACEVVVLCGNGCGVGAMKIVRGMYESRWTAEYLRRHPAEVEGYLESSNEGRLTWPSVSHKPHPAIRGLASTSARELSHSQKQPGLAGSGGHPMWSFTLL